MGELLRRKDPLIADVVNRENAEGVSKLRRNLATLQDTWDQPGGPVVSVDDLRNPGKFAGHLERSVREERKPARIVLVVDVCLIVNPPPTEGALIVNEIHRDLSRGAVERRPLFPKTNWHAERLRNSFERVSIDEAVPRHYDANIHPQRTKRRGQSGDSVCQTSRLCQGCVLASNHEDSNWDFHSLMIGPKRSGDNELPREAPVLKVHAAVVHH